MKIKNIIILMVTHSIFSSAVAMKTNQDEPYVVVAQEKQDGPYEVVVECFTFIRRLPEDWDIVEGASKNTCVLKFHNKEQEEAVINAMHDEYTLSYACLSYAQETLSPQEMREVKVKEILEPSSAQKKDLNEKIQEIMGVLSSKELVALCNYVRPTALYNFWHDTLITAKDIKTRFLIEEIIKQFEQAENKALLGWQSSALNILIDNLRIKLIGCVDEKNYKSIMKVKKEIPIEYGFYLYGRRNKSGRRSMA